MNKPLPFGYLLPQARHLKVIPLKYKPKQTPLSVNEFLHHFPSSLCDSAWPKVSTEAFQQSEMVLGNLEKPLHNLRMPPLICCFLSLKKTESTLVFGGVFLYNAEAEKKKEQSSNPPFSVSACYLQFKKVPHFVCAFLPLHCLLFFLLMPSNELM